MQSSFLTSQILMLTEVLTPEECQEQIELVKQLGLEGLRQGARNALEVRQRVVLQDAPTANALWERIAGAIPPTLDKFYQGALTPDPPVRGSLADYRAVGLNPHFRYYRYEAGERFPPHLDYAYEQTVEVRSFLTLILYLNEGYRGGDTRFDDVTVSPRAGMALIFPHELRHEGAVLEDGWKYVLRTDVMYQMSNPSR